jgi:transcriptional regulator with XRE-family HTH domain
MAVEYRAAAAKVGLRIRKARKDAGLSQDALASRVKTSRRNVLRWEGGYNMPRPEHIAAIAAETGKSLDYFLGEDEEEEAALHRVVDDLTRILLDRLHEARQGDHEVERV